MQTDRNNVDKKYKWDLGAIYASEEAFSADFSELQKQIEAFKSHEGVMTSSAKALYAALSDSAAIGRRINKLWCYAFLNFALNTSDNPAQARVAKVRSLAVSADAASWFVSPALISLDADTVERYYKECPELETFRRTIHLSQREKPHTLSDECEKMMAKLGDCLDSHENIRSIFANSDLQFGKIKDENGKTVALEDSSYVTRLMSLDRRVRRSAFKTLYKTYAQFANTFSTVYSSYVKEQCTTATIRAYDSSLAASTFRDEVTPEIYESLISSVRASLPVIHDYYRLKKEALGLSELHMYDLYAPLVSECDKKYSYEEAVSEVLKTAEIFGDEYYSALKAGLTERGWVDVYPSRGKQGGAFSAGTPDTEPYILLNYTDTWNDVSTLAHEAGHSMHSYFSRKYNEPHNSGYTIFVAEVASTVNELLLAHRKLKECTSREEELSILDGLMETYKGTLFRQTMFAEFERDAHAMVLRGEPLTADVLTASYKKLIDAYFGDIPVKDKEIELEWMRIPHFYSAFYVYKYATCISAASAIVKRLETEGEEYAKKYIEFLKCGGSRSPLDSLLVAGIDMRDPKVIRGAVADFADCIKRFREIY